MIPRQNPFPLTSGDRVLGWQWYDEIGDVSKKVYPSQRAALRGLLKYMQYLEDGPTLWQRLSWPVRFTLWPKIKEFLNDTRGAR